MIVDAKHLVRRDQAYRERTEGKPADLDRPSVQVHAPSWEPVPGDLADAAALFAFLSPEVRRFAVVMESLLRDPCGPERDPTRPGAMCQLLFQDATRLRAAVSHSGVTSSLGYPLPADHIDRNPRRVQQVLREAAKTACRALLAADACGALEEQS